jgi:L-lysine 6-transaminase
MRDEVLTALRVNEHVLALACGDRSLRFRPALSITIDQVDEGCDALARVLQKLQS